MGSLYRSQHELIGVFKHGQAAHGNNVELGRHVEDRGGHARVGSIGLEIKVGRETYWINTICRWCTRKSFSRRMGCGTMSDSHQYSRADYIAISDSSADGLLRDEKDSVQSFSLI